MSDPNTNTARLRQSKCTCQYKMFEVLDTVYHRELLVLVWIVCQEEVVEGRESEWSLRLHQQLKVHPNCTCLIGLLQ